MWVCSLHFNISVKPEWDFMGPRKGTSLAGGFFPAEFQHAVMVAIEHFKKAGKDLSLWKVLGSLNLGITGSILCDHLLCLMHFRI